MYIVALIDDKHSVRALEYLGKGSYVYGDNRYVVLSHFDDAREYKTVKTAINAIERMIDCNNYCNLYMFNRYRIINKDTKQIEYECEF